MSNLSANFTGVLLPVFYVRDALGSLSFYRDVCGFSTVPFNKHEASEGSEAESTGSPVFIRMCAATQEFALHLNDGTYDAVGGVRHYFAVQDVDLHHREIVRRGGSPTEIQDLPWMRLFSITDPDGHILFFQTPNRAWEARVLRRATRKEGQGG